MRHNRSFTLMFALASFAATVCVGQSVNIDYGDGAGTPSDFYAAAGLTGRWNNLRGEHGVPESVVGLDGTPTSVVVTLVEGSGGALTFMDDPATVGNEEPLLDDYAHGGTDVVGAIEFTGLENGLYDVIIYAWTPAAPEALTAVWPDCDLLGGGALIGGPWPGQLEEGVTHSRHTVTVSEGALRVCTAGGIAWSGAINGVQLVAVECPGEATGICALPRDGGPCDGVCPRYFFNACTGQCELFGYGCCKGNANNFLTREECEAACPFGSQEAIPAVSDWGLTAMTLLMLTAGSVALRRRRPLTS